MKSKEHLGTTQEQLRNTYENLGKIKETTKEKLRTKHENQGNLG